MIVILDGGSISFIVRKDDDGYHLVRKCHIHSIMDGESWQSDISQHGCRQVIMGQLHSRT